MTSTTLPRSDLLESWPRHRATPEVAVWQGGAGPDLVLIHGVGLRAEAWRPLADRLRNRFRITAVDMPGHGGSAPLGSACGLRDYAGRIGNVLATLDRPTIVVGHSMGAMVALELALSPEFRVRGVVAVNAIHRRSADAAAAVRARAAELDGSGPADPHPTLARWFGAAPVGRQRDMAEACRRWLLDVDREGYRQAYRVFAHENGPADGRLERLPCPALFVTGSNEPNSTAPMSNAMAERTPDGRAVIVDGARHMLPMTHADELAAAITDFAHTASRSRT